MNLESSVGERIRRLRRHQSLSLQAVADKVGVSKSLLSKVENGRISSPLSTYARIAVALGATVGTLLAAEDGGPCVVVRRTERKPMPGRATAFGYLYEALGHKKLDKLMEPFLVTYSPGLKEPPTFVGSSEEFVFLLKGRLEFVHAGQRFVLSPGDCLYADGRMPHGGRALGTRKAVALVVTAEPPTVGPSVLRTAHR